MVIQARDVSKSSRVKYEKLLNLQIRSGTAMRRFLLSILLAVSSVGFVKAQETTGGRAGADEEAKKEVVEVEHELIQHLLNTGKTERPSKADLEFFDRHTAETGVVQSAAGVLLTKAQLMDEFRSGERKLLAVQHDITHLYVYGNGDVVVETYMGHDKMLRKGKTYGHPTAEGSNLGTNVWVKQGGVWRLAVHAVTLLAPTQ
jgi:hypothetical protein